MTKRSMEDRIAEYVDSQFMIHRLKMDKIIFCCIRGNFGIYNVKLDLSNNNDSSCTCPAEYWPCKHVQALAGTYKIAPSTFFDLSALIENMRNKTKKELIEIIGKMIQLAPESLAVLGIKGFDAEEIEEY